MSWVSGWFTTTPPKYAPEDSHAATSFSNIQGYAGEERERQHTLQTRKGTFNMEEEEEIRRPYWQVRQHRYHHAGASNLKGTS